MAKTKTLATGINLESITKLINEYYCSNNYEVTESGEIHNTKTNKTLDNVKVIAWKQGYKFVKLLTTN